MEKQEIKDTVQQIFREVFEHEDIVLNETMTADDVEEWDSLTHVQLISEVEKTFQIKFKLKELNKMSNVGDLIDAVYSKLN